MTDMKDGYPEGSYGALLCAAYPKSFQRILKLSDDGEEFMHRTTAGNGSPGSVLASAFLWHDTDEGWDHWNALSERGHD